MTEQQRITSFDQRFNTIKKYNGQRYTQHLLAQRKAFVEKTSKDLQENRWTPFTELSAHEVEGKTLMILLQCGCCVVCGVLDNVREAKDMKDMNEGKVFLGDFAKVEAVFGKKSHGYPLAGDVDDMNGWYVRAARLPSKRDIARCVAEKL